MTDPAAGLTEEVKHIVREALRKPRAGQPCACFQSVQLARRCNNGVCEDAVDRVAAALSPAPAEAQPAATGEVVRRFADELRKWWSFDDGQQHTHSWHSREDFIATRLPALLSRMERGKGLTPENAWQDLVEKDDRTSPGEGPYSSMALISFDELKDYMLAAAPLPSAPEEPTR